MKVTGTGRYKTILRRFALAMAAASVFAAIPTTAMAAQVRLFVDPGHGGKDPGAVSGNVREKDTNLRISKYVAQAARRQGWAVKMSRRGDGFVSLNQRPRSSNGWRANAFVSVHSNSMGSRKTGHMTIYRNGPSKRLGAYIMKELAPKTKYRDLGNRRDSRGLAVLRGAKAPAVIVEVLSVSSPAERRVLKQDKTQRTVAEAIVKGIARSRGLKYVPPKAVKPKAQAAKPAPLTKSSDKPKRRVLGKPAAPVAKKPAADFAEAAAKKKESEVATTPVEKHEKKIPSDAQPLDTREPTSTPPGWLVALLDILNG